MTDVLDIHGVSKTFSTRTALSDMSFEVRAGELFGFVGSNGSGKTTTMRVILGVLESNGGEVTWAGKPLDLATRRTFGYMPEERGVYPKMKVGEQLQYFAEAHGMSAADAKASTAKWLERLGIDQYANDTVEKLSLGNQQRVQLAVALVHDPKVLILDEPFSGLDPIAVDVMSSVLKERAAAGVAVMFSSHQLELVEELCDRVGIVRDGKIHSSGTIEELRGTSEQWLVSVDGVSGDWITGVPGLRSTEVNGNEATFELREGTDAQSVLQTAQKLGAVVEFRRKERRLAEVFRSVVAEQPVTEQPATAEVVAQ